jgi:hypothetical protein
MRVLFELGRFLLADAARAASRKLGAAAERIDGAARDHEIGVPVDDGPLITEQASAMIARPPVEPEPANEPPLKGSLAERGRNAGQPWAR